MESFGIRKSKEELSAQVDAAEESLGERLTPYSIREDLEVMTIDEIKEKYPVRYEQYLQLLRNRDAQEKPPAARTFIAALNSVEDYIIRHEEGERILRDGQLSIFADLQNFLESGGKAGYVKAPTGIGKTVLFSQLIESLGLRTIVVVPRKILVTQTKEEFAEFTDLEVGMLYEKSKQLGRKVLVTTYNSLITYVKSGEIKPEEVDLLILDEAHRSLGDITQDTINQFEGAVKIGFTATLDLTQKSVPEQMDFEIHNMGLQEACDLSLVSEAKCIVVRTDVDLDSVRIAGTDYDQRDLERVINIEKRNLAAVKVYQQMFEGKRAIVNCGSIKHANDVVEKFRSEGVNAVAIHSGIPQEERERVLGNSEKNIKGTLHTGETPVVVNVGMLIEGFDEPRVEVALNVQPTKSPAIAEQRGGRALRLDKGNSGKVAYVVDFVDKITNHKNRPILFADIIQGAELTRPKPKDTVEGENLGETDTVFARPDLEIEGMKIIFTTDEIAELRTSLESLSPRLAPDGWRTITSIGDELGYGYKFIQRVINELGYEDHEVGQFDYNASEYTYYSPEVVERVNRYIEILPIAPPDWISTTEVFTRTTKGRSRFEVALQKFKQIYPSEWQEGLNNNGYITEYFSPVITQQILSELTDTEVMEGWLNTSEVYRMVKGRKSDITIKNIAKNIAKTKTREHIKKMPSRLGGMKVDHFSPSLVEDILNELEKYKPAPTDWRKVSYFIEELGVGKTTVKRRFTKYKELFPEDFQEYEDEKGYLAFYCSPKMAKLIEVELGQI